jgi:adenylate cyclase
MTDVFISYSRSDRPLVESLARALEHHGYSVWWDHAIAGGAAFAAEIERALHAARAVVVAWSVHGVQSEWVVDEASAAKQAGKIVPIQLDATPPPLGFRQYHALDFASWDGTADGPPIEALVQSIARFVRAGRPLPGAGAADERAAPALADVMAVLPLENLCGDASQQFFVDGMHEALITDLSKIGALKVISRTSTKVYAGSQKSLREIGAELGASKIIEGSVLRFGDEVRVSVQLIDAHSDTHLWAESFDRSMADVLALQRDVARAIADEISVFLTPAEAARLTSASRVRPAAYDSYLKGMYHWYKLTPQDLALAFRHFEDALAADANYAPAYAGIAAAWAGVQQMGGAPTAVAAPKIKTAVDKALELDPNLSQAHFTLATYYTWAAWDWARAEPAFLRAIELNPNFPDSHAYYAHYLTIVGRFEAADHEIRRALDLDPFNPLIRSLYVVCLMCWQRLDDALAEAQSVLRTAPDHWLGFQVIRLIYHAKGMHDETLQATRSLFTTLQKPSVVAALDDGYARGGCQAALLAAADELAREAETAFVQPMQVALLYGQANAIEQTVTWLEKAFAVNDPEMPYQKRVPRFPPAVMDHPRVQAIIDALNYPPDPTGTTAASAS